jgi:hypothetical protein
MGRDCTTSRNRSPTIGIAQVGQDYAARDVKVTQTGQFVADFHFYLDTEPKLDFVYELGNCPYQDLPPGLVSIYRPEESTPKRARAFAAKTVSIRNNREPSREGRSRHVGGSQFCRRARLR